ncbi:MAG: DUF1648 domain-containing protein [Syntrophomonadaceae bacterium]|nr:DUF1648 domain-containing protein [Syntrophomonadaceae bacterium]
MFADKWNAYLHFISLAALLVMVGLAAYYWPVLPEQIPHHFGPSGEADSWGGKYIIWLEPIMGAFFYAGLLLLRKNPQWSNFPWKITEQNQEVQYALVVSMLHWLTAECMLLFVYIQAVTIDVAFGNAAKMGMEIWWLVLVLLATIGYYTYYAYQRR